MKLLFALVCLVGVAVAEDCNGIDTTTCANEVCATGYVPTCELNICTCNPKPDPSSCTSLIDCTQYWFSHHCNNHQRQCSNGHCACVHGHGQG